MSLDARKLITNPSKMIMWRAKYFWLTPDCFMTILMNHTKYTYGYKLLHFWDISLISCLSCQQRFCSKRGRWGREERGRHLDNLPRKVKQSTRTLNVVETLSSKMGTSTARARVRKTDCKVVFSWFTGVGNSSVSPIENWETGPKYFSSVRNRSTNLTCH